MSLLPEFREGHFVLQVQAMPGTSLPEMIRIGGEISRQLLGEDEHCNRGAAGRARGTGRGHLGTKPVRVSCGIEAGLPGEEQEKMMDGIRDILDIFRASNPKW